MPSKNEPKEPPDKKKIRKRHNFDEFTQEQRDAHVKKTGKQIWEHDLCAFFVQRRKYGFPNSNGSFSSNLWEWIKQEHPLISTFCANKVHPFSGKERVLVLWCSFAFAFFLSAIFANSDKLNETNCVMGGGVFKGVDYSDESHLGTSCNDDEHIEWSGFCGGQMQACSLEDYPDAFEQHESGEEPSCGQKICTLIPRNREFLGYSCDFESDFSVTADYLTCVGDDCCQTAECL